jgi:hypothetical protein
MSDWVSGARRREEWSVQLTYPRSMVPPHTESFCSWFRRLRGKLAVSKRGLDLKDDKADVIIEKFSFANYDDACEFCRYTCQALDKWSGGDADRRYTIKLRGRIKTDAKSEGRVGSGRAQARVAADSPDGS